MTAPARIARRPLVQSTSRSALRDRPLGPVDSQILAVVAAKGGACDHEIEAATGLSHQTCSGNRRHLVERGKLHASSETRPTPSGRKAIVWKLGPSPDAFRPGDVPPFRPAEGPREQMRFGEGR